MKILMIYILAVSSVTSSAASNVSVVVDGVPYSCSSSSGGGSTGQCRCQRDTFGTYRIFFKDENGHDIQVGGNQFGSVLNCTQFMNTSDETKGLCHP